MVPIFSGNVLTVPISFTTAMESLPKNGLLSFNFHTAFVIILYRDEHGIIRYLLSISVKRIAGRFEDVLSAIKKKNLKVTTAKAGLTLDFEKDVTVKMVAPVNTYDDANSMSAVVKLMYGSTSFLLTGDAETKSENDIITSKENIKADVLLIGHHGSNSSTSQKFLDAVNPKYAVIQVGKNSYGHPTYKTIQKLNAKKIKIYRSKETLYFRQMART